MEKFRTIWIDGYGRHSRYGAPLACPNCSGTDFSMHRDSIHPEDSEDAIAVCASCHTSTYAFALKEKYSGNDFEIAGKEKEGISFTCTLCGERYEDATEFYEATTYKNTSYTVIDPEPNMERRCPKHPEAEVRIWRHTYDGFFHSCKHGCFV